MTVYRISTRAELAAKLLKLSRQMRRISVDMEYYGGFAEWAKHSQEMLGASVLAKEWAAEIAAEEFEEVSR